MKTRNMNGVIEEMTQDEYNAKIERGMELEIIKEVKKKPAPKKPAKKK